MEYVLMTMMFLILFKIYLPTAASKVLPTIKQQAPSIIPVASSTHSLVRVWRREDVVHDSKGWWFECSCGQKGPALGIGPTSYSTEARAVETFKIHTNLYRGLEVMQGNPLDKELNKVKADYAEYRKKCYCKDANDDLLIMKKEGKWD